MAIKSLFNKAEGYYIKADGFLIPFDLLMSENHDMEAVVAEHPVDSKSSVAIHIHNKLRSGQFEVLISNWSLNQAPSSRYEITEKDDIGLGGIDTKYTVKLVGGFNGVRNRAQDTYDALKQLYEARKTVTIVLGLEVYPQVAIERISAKRTEDSGDAQKFTIAFKEVRTVTLKKITLTTSTSKIDTNADSENRQVVPTSDYGKQSVEDYRG